MYLVFFIIIISSELLGVTRVVSYSVIECLVYQFYDEQRHELRVHIMYKRLREKKMNAYSGIMNSNKMFMYNTCIVYCLIHLEKNMTMSPICIPKVVKNVATILKIGSLIKPLCPKLF